MNREDIARMAREVGIDWHRHWDDEDNRLERFAALVEAHVNAKEKERQRYDIHSCGPDCDRYICVAVRNEREACAKVADDHERQRCEAWAKVLTTGGEVPSASLSAVAAAIRARGQQ